MDAVRGDIDAVLDAVLDDIEQTALNPDLLDGGGTFFNPGSGPADANGQDTGYDEPYDYPWTNNAIQARRTALYLDGRVYAAAGGRGDDPWLAASAPVLDTNGDGMVDASDQPYWRQVSDVYGNWVYSNVGTASNLAVPRGNWRDLPVGDADRNGTADSNDTTPGTQDQDDNGFLRVNSPFLVDADNDGIGDSRWAWPSVPAINGVIYVTAIRIVDASSLLNPDTALGLTDAGGNFGTFADAPRWLYPTDLDLNYFAAGFEGVTDGIDDAKNLYRYRLGLATPPSTPLVPLLDRIDHWTFAASRTGPNFTPGTNTAGNHRSLTLTDEFDLRIDGGLGDGQQRVATARPHRSKSSGPTCSTTPPPPPPSTPTAPPPSPDTSASIRPPPPGT